MKFSFVIFSVVGIILGIIIMLLLPNFVLFPAKIQSSLFSIEHAPKKSIQAQIISYTPDVSWESRVATIPAELTNTVSISQGEEIDTGSGSAIIALDPFGTISVAKDTTIDFIQLLPFNMVLLQGKGTVVYTNTKNGQLGVVTGNLLIQITSGMCSVTVNTKTNTITIAVASGVSMVAYNDTNYTSHVLTVTGKQTYIFDNLAKTGVLKKV